MLFFWSNLAFDIANKSWRIFEHRRINHFINNDQLFFYKCFLYFDNHFHRVIISRFVVAFRDRRLFFSWKHSLNFDEKIDLFKAWIWKLTFWTYWIFSATFQKVFEAWTNKRRLFAIFRNIQKLKWKIALFSQSRQKTHERNRTECSFNYQCFFF
jgi:hypothetical protein